jgi:hypothetical protein
MARVFTMQRCCRFCRTWFTIAGSNHWFCGNADCTRRRRKADRAARRQVIAAPGSDAQLARALRDGE